MKMEFQERQKQREKEESLVAGEQQELNHEWACIEREERGGEGISYWSHAYL
jgi:hypothetical protein